MNDCCANPDNLVAMQTIEGQIHYRCRVCGTEVHEISADPIDIAVDAGTGE